MPIQGVPKLRVKDISSSNVSEVIEGGGGQLDAKYNQYITELKKYSITPRTLQEKTFYVTSTSDITPHRFEEEYEYSGNKVRRYGLNNSEMIVAPGGNLLGEGGQITKTKSSGVSMGTNQYPLQNARNATLHSLEKSLITEAVSHLQHSNCNAVVVDIFEREGGRDIFVDSNNNPCIHSVVICKTTLPTKFRVVDPSCFRFSSHLQNNNLTATINIETLHDRLKIYSPPQGAPIGYGKELWRDCTDIAVKLAFGFNQDTTLMNASATYSKNDVQQHPVIELLTNNKDVDKHMFIDSSLVAYRSKQASSSQVTKAVQAIQLHIDKMLQQLKQFTKDATVKKAYSDLVSSCKDHTFILKKLSELEKTSGAILETETHLMNQIAELHTDVNKAMVDAELLELLGEV